MKHSLKDREIQGVQALISGLTDIWDDLTFEDVQIVFLDLMERLSWVINNNGECYIKWTNWILDCFHRRREMVCRQDVLPMLYV
jgi:hypothetical protein